VSTYDVIVIGAGHNGLTTAAALARAGRAVLVVEARDTPGGLAGAHEFHPGFRRPVLHDTSAVRTWIVRQLDLDKHGLRLRSVPPDVMALGQPGEALLLRGDRAGALDEIAARSQHDAAQLGELHDFAARARDALGAFLDEPPVDVLDVESAGAWDLLRRALRVRKLRRRDLLELMRLPPMCVADWLDERFELDVLKAVLAFPAVAGDFTGPRSPGTNAAFLFGLCTSGPGIEGGGPALVAALEKAARAAGADIRTNARVEAVRVDRGVGGVRLETGEEIDAPVVAASCHPAETFLRLLPRRTLPVRLVHRMQRFRSRGTAALVSFALRSRPRFPAHDADGAEFARTGASLNDLERAFDAVKYGRLPEQPVLQLHVSPATSAATGTEASVLSALVHAVPYVSERQRSDATEWSDAARVQLGDRVQEIVESHCGALDVVARHVWLPRDLEKQFSLPQGNLHHGERSLDQILVRPVPECARYATPIPGLFLCGSGSHPGGGITCAPGALAAQAIRSRT
jgi:phytoene dehydrogenase-like protein